MAKKKRQLVTGKHAETYDREFRQYLNMHEDAKGANKIPYYSDENKFYLLKKSEKKTIKQLYDKSSKARSMFRPNLFLSKKGSLFELNKDGSVVYRESREDEKTGREKWQLCFTPNLKEKGGTNIQVYQLTNLLFGLITPKAQKILDEEGLSAMVKLKSTDITKVRTHHNKGKGTNPKYTMAMSEPGHTTVHKTELHKEVETLEDIKSQLELTQVLSEETEGKPYIAIQKAKTDKAKFIILEEKDIPGETQAYINNLALNINILSLFNEYLKECVKQNGDESIDEYLGKLAILENGDKNRALRKVYDKFIEGMSSKQER